MNIDDSCKSSFNVHSSFSSIDALEPSPHRSSQPRRSRWSLHPQNLWSRRNLISPGITSRKRRDHGGFPGCQTRLEGFFRDGFSLRFVLYDGILWFRPSRHVIKYTMLIYVVHRHTHISRKPRWDHVIHGKHGIWQPDIFGTWGHRGEKVPGPWVLCCLAMRK